jgi:hypothetical protein
MQNFVYLVGDAKTREAVVVDAAWDVKGIRAVLAADNMNLVSWTRSGKEVGGKEKTTRETKRGQINVLYSLDSHDANIALPNFCGHVVCRNLVLGCGSFRQERICVRT